MTPQQYAIEHGLSVQQAKKALGKRRSKNVFAAHSAAPKPQPNVPDATPAVAAVPAEATRIAA